MLKLRTAAILALSLSLAPASAREFHSGHARGFNGHATTSTDMQQEASIAADGMVADMADIADMADMADTGAATEHGYHSQPEPLS